MKEQKCNHIGFIKEYDNGYICTNCGKQAVKTILTGICGTWVNGNEPQEVKNQLELEKALYIQKENQLKSKK